MPLDPRRFLDRVFPEKEYTYIERDTSLYALSVGMAQDPLFLPELQFVCGAPLKVLPSQATVIAWDYDFILDSGIDEVLILHGGQSVTIHNPLPAAATIVSQFRIRDLHDKGAGKGAVIVGETRIRDKATGAPLCTNLWTSYARGEGGFGGARGPSMERPPMPVRAPDAVIETRTSTNQALFYRLLGDVNPLHSDPAIAAAAGFDRPIMHGNCTFGITCRALVAGMCGYAPERLLSLDCLFTAPGMPGDTVRTEMWKEGSSVRFRSLSKERGIELAGGGEAVVV